MDSTSQPLGKMSDEELREMAQKYLLRSRPEDQEQPDDIDITENDGEADAPTVLSTPDGHSPGNEWYQPYLVDHMLYLAAKGMSSTIPLNSY